MNPLNAHRVLGRERCHDAGAIAPVRCKGLKVSLVGHPQVSGGFVRHVSGHTWMPAPPPESEPAMVKTGVTFKLIIPA